MYTLERLKSERRPVYLSRARSISLVPTVRSKGRSNHSLLAVSEIDVRSEVSARLEEYVEVDLDAERGGSMYLFESLLAGVLSRLSSG